ncbi:MAG TPA: 4-hydroxy-tetrahydrodipicolinate reductase [Chlamydiales bacterium]|nr:4-hydroxy-tetrahydrodipicolinate reductase [Chlamydiales bacterium]
MRALLIGHGKMGKLIDQLAPEQNVDIVRILEREGVLSDTLFSDIDVAIDFSSPDTILKRIEMAMKCRVPLVVGTTGWEKEKPAAETIIKKAHGAMIYSANFSIGVQLFYKICRHAAKLVATNEQYDVTLLDHHHRQKKDHPSGTTKELAHILLQELQTKSTFSCELPDGDVDKKTLYAGCLRSGFQPGKHATILDSLDDTIEITHTARSRSGFARGALQAAHWIQGKTGFFTMDDLL